MKRQQFQEQQKQQQQQQAIMQEQQQYIQQRMEKQVTRQQVTSQQRGQLWWLKNQEIIFLSNSLSNMKNLNKKSAIENLSWHTHMGLANKITFTV